MAGQCAGHTDFYGRYFVVTRHLVGGVTSLRVVAYTQLDPESIPVRYVHD